MHGSLSQFKATLQRKKERSEAKNRGNFSRKNSLKNQGKLTGKLNHPKMSESEFIEFKSKLEAERRRQIFKDLFLLITVLTVLMVICFFLFK